MSGCSWDMSWAVMSSQAASSQNCKPCTNKSAASDLSLLNRLVCPLHPISPIISSLACCLGIPWNSTVSRIKRLGPSLLLNAMLNSMLLWPLCCLPPGYPCLSVLADAVSGSCVLCVGHGQVSILCVFAVSTSTRSHRIAASKLPSSTKANFNLQPPATQSPPIPPGASANCGCTIVSSRPWTIPLPLHLVLPQSCTVQ